MDEKRKKKEEGCERFLPSYFKSSEFSGQPPRELNMCLLGLGIAELGV